MWIHRDLTIRPKEKKGFVIGKAGLKTTTGPQGAAVVVFPLKCV